MSFRDALGDCFPKQESLEPTNQGCTWTVSRARRCAALLLVLYDEVWFRHRPRGMIITEVGDDCFALIVGDTTVKILDVECGETQT